MNEGYGKSVLGYFGRLPLAPDPEVVRDHERVMPKPDVFTGDPPAAAPDSLGPAKKALEERGLPVR
ncbi:MAG: hypothetical protein R3E97_11625 [Candidatus Eisenbacteria bacterium]